MTNVTDLEDVMFVNHNLPEGKYTTIWDSSSYIDLSAPSRYLVEVELLEHVVTVM